MTTERSLLQRISRQPRTVDARLVYSDWLDEQGRARDADRIRHGIALQARPDDLALAARAAACLPDLERGWASLPHPLSGATIDAEYRGGFPYRLTVGNLVPAARAAWREAFAALAELAPTVRALRLTTAVDDACLAGLAAELPDLEALDLRWWTETRRRVGALAHFRTLRTLRIACPLSECELWRLTDLPLARTIESAQLTLWTERHHNDLSWLARFPALRELTLRLAGPTSHLQLDERGGRIDLAPLTALRQLRALDLGGGSSIGIGRSLRPLAELPHLEALDLDTARLLTLPPLPTLRRLHLRARLRDDAAPLPTSLEALALTDLRICCTPDEREPAAVIRALAAARTIERLWLTGFRAHGACADAICRLAPTLQRLRVDGQPPLEAIARMRALRALEIREHHYIDHTVVAALGQLPRLESLECPQAYVGWALDELVRACPRLRRLALYDDCGELDAIAGLPALRDLSLTRGGLEPTTIRWLLTVRPLDRLRLGQVRRPAALDRLRATLGDRLLLDGPSGRRRRAAVALEDVS